MSITVEGIFPPIVTPFVDGEVSLEKLRENTSKWNETGLSGYVVLGSNGEFPHLTEEEKLKVVKTVVEAASPGKMIIVGTGRDSTRETIALTNKLADLGAEAALIVPPYYYKPKIDSEVLIRHYSEVAERSKIPLLIYQVPMFAGVNIPPSVVSELSKHPNIIGIKDTSGNITQIVETIATTPPDFSMLAGTATFLYPALAAGAKGGILALANVAPEACVKIYRLFKDGKHDEARELQLKIVAANKAVTATYGIGGLKAVMEMRGYFGGLPRRPLPPVSEEAREKLRSIFKEAGLL